MDYYYLDVPCIQLIGVNNFLCAKLSKITYIEILEFRKEPHLLK